jgi:hypothetical protein
MLMLTLRLAAALRAEALAARANLPDLLDALRAAGAHIEPAVWHTATAVIRTDCLPRGVAVAPQERAEDPAFEAKCALKGLGFKGAPAFSRRTHGMHGLHAWQRLQTRAGLPVQWLACMATPASLLCREGPTDLNCHLSTSLAADLSRHACMHACMHLHADGL